MLISTFASTSGFRSASGSVDLREGIREAILRNSQFLDRCFAAGMLLAILGFFGAMAYAVVESEPRTPRATLILHR